MTVFLKGGAAVSALAISLAFTPIAAAQDATIQIGGRLMLDYAIADIQNPDVDVTASEVRRARLFAKGKYGNAISYKFEFNHTTGGDFEVTDGFVQFAPENQNFKVKVGHFKTHNSLEEEASSRFISTIERGAFTDAFGLDRRIGVSVGTGGDNYTLNVGVYGENINNDDPKMDGKAIAARATYLPIKTDETLLHLGASWRYRDANSASDLRYRQRPYAHVLSSENSEGVLSSGRIINTGNFADSDNFYGAEGLVIHNNLWAAGEYAILDAKGSGTNPNGSFGGGYIEGGIVLGGRKTYKASGGTFNRMKVDNPFGSGGMGALALVARYDTIDLEDNGYTGKLDTVILGADWWPTKQTRLRINYFDADATNGAAESAKGVTARVGFDF